MRISFSLADRALDGMERMAVTEGNLWAAFVTDTSMCLGLTALGAGSGKDLLWQALHFGSHLFIVGLPSAYLARALDLASRPQGGAAARSA